MNKSYNIHEKWSDLDKVNNVEINSVDGVIESIFVNGEPAGGGGGLTTAVLTVINTGSSNRNVRAPFIDNGVINASFYADAGTTVTKTVVKGSNGCSFTISAGSITEVTGNGSMSDNKNAIITGDCTITIS